MTSFEVRQLPFDRTSVAATTAEHPRLRDWPVVYVLSSARQVYVGETLKFPFRMRQHLDSGTKSALHEIRVVEDDTFHKSATLDLESTLIRLFAGDGQLEVLNRNDGIVSSDYYDRTRYQSTFDAVFEKLRSAGMFTRSIPEIENDDLFKLSPFKALNSDQAAAIESIMDRLHADLESGEDSLSVVSGDPGTGKTIVGIYLLKLLRDLDTSPPDDVVDGDTLFSEYYLEDARSAFRGLKVALVVPQQSLRSSVSKVFRKTPFLREAQVLSPFDVGTAPDRFDVVVVDEAHRLNQYAAQAHGTLTKKFREITTDLFGAFDPTKTQLDWIRAKSRHTILLLDREQSVRPADLRAEDLDRALAEVSDERRHRLHSQMRAGGGNDYVAHVRALLSDPGPSRAVAFGSRYEFGLVDSLAAMRDAIVTRDEDHGLCRLVAGYAWEWVSRHDPGAHDIVEDGVQLRWNVTATDWINSPTAVTEVGSIHTVQGYDLNYAGVIVGRDIRWDAAAERVVVDRDHYFDRAGWRNNRLRNQVTTDEDLLRYIRNVYAVLMTRAMRGTFVYVCDEALRQRWARFVPTIDL